MVPTESANVRRTIMLTTNSDCFPKQHQQSQLLSLYPHFLDAFAKLLKATIRFVVCVRQSVRVKQLGPERIFMKSDIRLFRQSVWKHHVSLKSDKNNWYFT